MKFLKSGGLYDLKSVGQHMLHSARREGKGTSTPLAFMGAITVAIGAKMLWEAYKQKQIEGGRNDRSR